MSAPIIVVDYGLGNIRSVAGAVSKLGFAVAVSNQRRDLEHAEKLILPGVGAFGDGMRLLDSQKLTPLLNELVLASLHVRDLTLVRPWLAQLQGGANPPAALRLLAAHARLLERAR